MTAEKFVKLIKKDLSKNSVRLELRPKKYVLAEGIRFSGYFDSLKKVIVCATDYPTEEWLSTLVHEYSHFCQWAEDTKVWRSTFINGEDVGDTWILWTKGNIKLPKKIVKKHMALTRNLEVDCERRAVDLIIKYKLPINNLTYIMKANSYIYFYNYAFLRKRWWNKGKAPYRNPDCWCNFPPFFKKRYSQLPKYYIEAYDEYC